MCSSELDRMATMKAVELCCIIVVKFVAFYEEHFSDAFDMIVTGMFANLEKHFCASASSVISGPSTSVLAFAEVGNRSCQVPHKYLIQ